MKRAGIWEGHSWLGVRVPGLRGVGGMAGRRGMPCLWEDVLVVGRVGRLCLN